MRAFNPKIADAFSNLRKKDPAAASRLLQKRFPRVRSLLRLQSGDPQMFALRVKEAHLNRKTVQLRRAYFGTKEPDQKLKIQDQLHDTLRQSFDNRQAIRQRELEQLAERLETLREEHRDAAERRDALIEQSLRRVIKRWKGPLRPGPKPTPATQPKPSANTP